MNELAWFRDKYYAAEEALANSEKARDLAVEEALRCTQAAQFARELAEEAQATATQLRTELAGAQQACAYAQKASREAEELSSRESARAEVECARAEAQSARADEALKQLQLTTDQLWLHKQQVKTLSRKVEEAEDRWNREVAERERKKSEDEELAAKRREEEEEAREKWLAEASREVERRVREENETLLQEHRVAEATWIKKNEEAAAAHEAELVYTSLKRQEMEEALLAADEARVKSEADAKAAIAAAASAAENAVLRVLAQAAEESARKGAAWEEREAGYRREIEEARGVGAGKEEELKASHAGLLRQVEEAVEEAKTWKIKYQVACTPEPGALSAKQAQALQEQMKADQERVLRAERECGSNTKIDDSLEVNSWRQSEFAHKQKFPM